MKKGFTLMELIVVIIILGILSTLGFGQYTLMVEKSRGAEARAILGTIRMFATGYYMEHSTKTPLAADLGIGAGGVPGPAVGNCKSSHYFWYSVSGNTAKLEQKATRCGDNGKAPAGNTSATLTLTSNLQDGTDTWGGNSGY